MTDGLGTLRQQRAKATKGSARHVPPPRHPKKVTATAAEATPQATSQTVQKMAGTQQAPQAREELNGGGALKETTIPRSVQLDEAADDFLDRVRSAGRRARVDANRSAVIRLALRQMESQMTPEEVAALLRTNNQRTGKAGRHIL